MITDRPTDSEEIKRRLAADRAIGVLALTIPVAFLRAYIFYQIWAWYAPSDWPKLPFRGALLIWFLWLLVPRPEPKDADPLVPWSQIIFRAVIFPLITFALAGTATWLIR